MSVLCGVVGGSQTEHSQRRDPRAAEEIEEFGGGEGVTYHHCHQLGGQTDMYYNIHTVH